MKLNIEQSKLAEILETAYLAISPKPTDPILGNILLIANEDGIVSATGTNLTSQFILQQPQMWKLQVR